MASDIAVWISGGSLLVSAAALWRSGRVRVLDLRTSIRRQVAELRLEFAIIPRTIDAAVVSRQSAHAAVGRTGATAAFRQTAEADKIAVPQWLAKLDEIGAIPLRAGYAALEAKMVAVQEVRTRLDQLTQKYAAAAREDEKTRQCSIDAATARTSGSTPPIP